MYVLSDKKRPQKKYYDRHAKPLPSISPGEMLQMRLPGQKVWTPATCLDSVGPHSFLVKSGSTVYRRNRRDIIKTSENPVTSQTFVPKETPLSSSSGTVSPGHTRVHVPSTPATAMPFAELPSFQPDVPPTGLRRSQREKKTPGKISQLCFDVTRPQPDFVITLIFARLLVCFLFFMRKGVTNARAYDQMPSLDFDYSCCLTSLLE